MRKNYSLVTTLLCLLVLTFTTSYAQQTASQPWGVGVSLVKSAYNGDIGNGFFNFNQPFQGQVGLKVDRYISPSFDLSVGGSYGRWGYFENTVDNFLSNMLQMNMTANYKFSNGYLLPEDSKIAPYLFAGVGFANFKAVDGRSTPATNFTIPVGIGATWNVNDNFGVFWQSTYGFTNDDMVDMMQGDAAKNTMMNGNDHYMLHQLGAKFNIGSKPDSDGDGISDDKDRCPNAAGLEKLGGCPDADMDGIADKDDTCPNQAGKANLNGCPDSDNDGIADREDDCPQIAGNAAFRGCPDTDNDGISDKEDKCPSIKGTRANKGCPEVSATTKEVFAQALQGIQFETGKAVIKDSSFPILNQVVQVMKDNPYYQLTIEGHTDSQGKESSNMTLSQNRANSVMKYLSTKGVEATRMTAIGYGESSPVATNETPEGRKQNRRVAFKVSF